MEIATKKPELLAPAGDYSCFRAALKAGADAVYIGGQKFGARAFAGNFSDEEVVEALKEALKNNNIDEIKAKQEDLQKSFYEISAKLYQAAQAEQQQNGAQAGPTVNEDGSVNTDATEVDDNNNK